MPKMTRGGRQLLSELDYLAAQIVDAAALDRARVVFDPVGAAAALAEITALAAELRRLMHAELSPMLERAATNREAASLPERVARLEAEVAELRAATPRPAAVTRLRPRATGE